MAASRDTKRYVAFSRLYHKALKAKDQRSADRYWALAMKYNRAATAAKKAVRCGGAEIRRGGT